MKALYQITSGETEKVLINRRRIAKDLNGWLRQTVFTIFLAAFLLMIFAPAIASTTPGKNVKSECRHKIIRFTYPVIKANKNSSGHNKDYNRSKKRKYSFPV
jgi:hypothetical protein